MEILEFLEPLYDSIESMISRYGSLGIGAAMFAESAGVPFASSIVFLTAGTMILRGTCSFWSIFIYSTFGITLGSIFSYTVGLLGSMLGNAVNAKFDITSHFFKKRRSKPKAFLGQSKILSLWDKYGNFSIFMGQLWGVSRTFISFPAGAMHMNFLLFIIYTFLGGALFSLLTIGASLILTGTMSFVIRTLKTMVDFSPWLLLIPAVLITIFIYYYRHRGWKMDFSFLNNYWNRIKKASKLNNKKNS